MSLLQPRPADYPRIRTMAKVYYVTSNITGIMLLLLLIEMILKYSPTHVELFAGGTQGGLHFAPVVVGESCQWYSLFNPFQEGCEMTSTGDGTNLSLLILIIHGWFYVAYLVSVFLLWSPMRWRFSKFLLLALAGVIPLMCFFLERRVVRDVNAFVDAREAELAAGGPGGPAGGSGAGAAGASGAASHTAQ